MLIGYVAVVAGQALPQETNVDMDVETSVEEDDGGGVDLRVRIRLQADTPAVDAVRVQQSVWLQQANWTLAALVERDPYERRWHDHTTFFARRSTAGLDLLAGHLRPSFGQGLLFGRGRSAGTPSPVARRRDGAVGYRSAAEAHTMTGLAARVRLGDSKQVHGTVALVAGGLGCAPP